MNRLSVYVIALSLFGLVNFSQAEPRDEHASIGQQIDKIFSHYSDETPGVAVSITQDGEVIFSKGFGSANLEHNIAITPDTVFHAASVSKQFTAFAIYLLEKQGKLSFEDDIRKYIPELSDYGTEIKISQLLAHTSGLRDQWALLTLAGWRMDDVITTEQILGMVVQQEQLNFIPGSEFGYSNTGYTLLAETVARITGMSFAEYTHAEIFEPLGMTNTKFYDNHQDLIKNRADSYDKYSGPYQRRKLNFATVGPTSLMTTAEDMSKWALNFENPIVGDAKLMEDFNQPSRLNDGSKVVFNVIGNDILYHAKGQLIRVYRGQTVFKHGGHDAGFRAFLGRFPEQKITIVTLSNDEHYEIFKSGLEIAEILMPDSLDPLAVIASGPSKSSKAEKPQKSEKPDLANYSGRYFSAELSTTYDVTITNGVVELKHYRLGNIPFDQKSKDSFTGVIEFPISLVFLRDPKGYISGFEVSNFGAKNVLFKKTDSVKNSNQD